MTSLFDKLNLRPSERRLVVVVVSAVFLVLNYFFVWAHFGELGRVQQRTRDTRKKLELFQSEIKKEPDYQREMRKLAEMGALVAEDARALELQREVSSQALASGVAVQRYDPSLRQTTGRTNAFFDEQSLVITINSGEKELVDFLYNLAERNSLIRVRSMFLQPDTPQHRLEGRVTLVASYQKKPPPKPATPPVPAATAAAKPSAPAATPPAKAPPTVTSPLAKPPPVPPTDTAAKAKPTTATPPPPPLPGETPRLRELPKRIPPPTPPPPPAP